MSNNIFNNISLSDFISGTNISIKTNINYLMASPFFKAVVAHKIALSEKIDLYQDEVVIHSPKFKIENTILRNKCGSYRNMVYRMADFSQTTYHQYDVVTSLLPMINIDFFNLLAENNKSYVKGNIILGCYDIIDMSVRKK